MTEANSSLGKRITDFGMEQAKLIVLIILTATLASAGSKISPDVRRLRGPNVNIIVQFHRLPTDSDHERILANGGVLQRKLHLINAASYAVPSAVLSVIAADPAVAYVTPDRPVRATLNSALDYSAETINAVIARQYGFDGTGIGVAVIDSGITPVDDLSAGKRQQSRIVYSEDFVNAGGGAKDQYGHGTHVAGMLAGNGEDSTGGKYTYTFRGVAPNVQIVNLRVLDRYGSGTDNNVIAAIHRAIELKDQYKIRIINLSLGRSVYESYTQDPLCQAVEAAWNAGIVVVVAAGNDGRDNSHNTNGYGTINSPGNDPHVITVGAMKTEGTPSRSDDLIASYSSKGPTLLDHIVKPDIIAPGNRIISLRAPNGWLDSEYQQNRIPVDLYSRGASDRISSNYFQLSGTSMATPMVSGAAALMLQKEPLLTPDQVKARLMKTATKAFPAVSIATYPLNGATYQSQYDIFTVGAGYLDVWAALNSSDVASGTALSPIAIYDSSTGTVSMSIDSSALWGNSLVWGTSVVWGDSVLIGGSSVIWGNSVVWGDSLMQGFSVVWGSSVVWGNSTPGAASLDVLVYGEN